MVRLILVTTALVLLALFAIWTIAKLPSRYDRKPAVLSEWNALDRGIDPSIADGGEL